MASRDSVLASNDEIPIQQKEQYGFLHNHVLPVAQNHDLGRGLEEVHGHDMDVGRSHGHDMDVVQNHGHDMDVGLSHGHDVNLGRSHGHDVNLGQSHRHDLDLSQCHGHDLDLGRSHGHDMDLGRSHGHDLGLGQSHGHDMDCQSHGHDMDCLSHGHDMDLGGSHEHDMDLSGSHGHDMDLGRSHGHDIDLGQSHGRCLHSLHSHSHDLVLQHANKQVVSGDDKKDVTTMRIHGLDHDLEIGFNHEQDGQMSHSEPHEGDDGHLDDANQADIEDHGRQLALIDESHELDLSDPHDFDGSIELHVDHSQEMTLMPPSPLELHQSDLMFSVPVVQSRTLIPSPNHELQIGQEFPDVMSCRRALRDAAISLHFEIQTVKSDKTRFTAKCASEGCPWRIHAAKLPGVPTFTIRTLNDSHTCGGITHLGHQQASVQWVANTVEQSLRENPNYRPKEILEEIHRAHGITLSYKQAWRGKERILAAVRGSIEEGYRLLPQYCQQIRRTNPGSIAAVYANPVDNCFQRLFVSFQACIHGFLNGCRPLIGLDSISLKSKYLGSLLLATGFDGDGALFPLAFGLVDEETDDNWMWFMSEMHSLLEINAENMLRLTILSDRRNSIVNGVEANFPTAFHGFCMRHLSESFKKEFNNTMLVNLLWEAAQALTIVEFEAKLLEVEEVSPDAAYWIRQIPPRLWATAYFEGKRFGQLTANAVDSLNSWILEPSGLPLVQMMECIRRQLMTWFNERREVSMQWKGLLVPSAERLLSEAIEHARSYQVLRANEAEFEVISHEGTNIVDIRNRGCLCHGWQVHGLPCAHAVAALLSCRQNVHRFTESFFTVASYRKAYSQTIHPIPDRTLWNETLEGSHSECEPLAIVINPPKSIRPPGRPRKKRSRPEDRGRAKRIVHCSRCNQTGHFRTTCAAPI